MFEWYQVYDELAPDDIFYNVDRNVPTMPLATSPLPSWGPTSGRNCYVTPAFSGVPKSGSPQVGRIAV